MTDRDLMQLLPKGDYCVVRRQLPSGRVVLLCLPDGVTLDEAQQLAGDLRAAADEVLARAGEPPLAASIFGSN